MSSNALVVAAAKKHLIEFSPEELDIIKRQFFPPDATEPDINFCLEVARTLGFNPLLKQIYFVPRKTLVKEGNVERWVEKTEPMIGRDSLLTFAHRSKELLSISSSAEIREYPHMDPSGTWKMASTLVATAEVHRKGFEKPFVVEVGFNEYAQKTKDGKFTKFWQTIPVTMIKKVAESQALKKAFNIDDNVLTVEEQGIGYIDDAGTLVKDPDIIEGELVEGSQGKPNAPAANAAEEPVEAVQADTTGATVDPLITTGQAHEITSRISDYSVDYGKFLDYMEVQNICEITQSKYGTAIAALESKRRRNESESRKNNEQPDLLGAV